MERDKFQRSRNQLSSRCEHNGVFPRKNGEGSNNEDPLWRIGVSEGERQRDRQREREREKEGGFSVQDDTQSLLPSRWCVIFGARVSYVTQAGNDASRYIYPSWCFWSFHEGEGEGKGWKFVGSRAAYGSPSFPRYYVDNVDRVIIPLFVKVWENIKCVLLKVCN